MALVVAVGSGVLANDSDSDAGEILTVTAFDAVSAKGAAVNVNSDGSYTYDPSGSAALDALAAGEVITDTFTYIVSDANGAMDKATVNIAITGTNDGSAAPSDADVRLGVWTGSSLKGHLDYEAFLGEEIEYAHLKIGLQSWEHAKSWSLTFSNEFAPVGDRVTLSVIFDLLPKDGSTTFADIINGYYDADLRIIAENLIGGGHGDAVLRLMHEADMATRSWTFRNGNASDYIATWRHVHDVMMKVPGAEFKWQYSLNGEASRQLKENGVFLTELGYPGDDYVDSISIGNYDRGSWADNWPAIKGKLDFIHSFAASHGKRMDIAEWGLWSTTDGGAGDNPSFLENTLDWFKALPDSQKGYLLYFNAHSKVNLSQYPNSEDMFLDLFGPAGPWTHK